MKAKDIVLLCAAASAGAVTAGVAAKNASLNTQKKTVKKPAAKKTSARMPGAVKAPSEPAADIRNVKMYQLNLIAFPEDLSDAAVCLTDDMLTAAAAKCFRFSPVTGITGVRCPSHPLSTAYSGGCTVYVTEKGCLFLYDDPEKEPVLKEFCGARNVFPAAGGFEIYSDGMLYITDLDGNTAKTVSLSGMFDLKEGDICDAENSDDSFALAAVNVTKSEKLGGTRFTAVLTDEGRSYIITEEDDFHLCEESYTGVSDMCVYGSYAYYLTENNMLIKMKINSAKCSTEGRYSLGQTEGAEPVSVTACSCGLVILYSDGSVRPILPEMKGEREKAAKKDKLRRLNLTLAECGYGIRRIVSDENTDYVYILTDDGSWGVIHIS